MSKPWTLKQHRKFKATMRAKHALQGREAGPIIKHLNPVEPAELSQMQAQELRMLRRFIDILERMTRGRD